MSDTATPGPAATPNPRIATVWEDLFGQTEGLRIRLALNLLADSQLTRERINDALIWLESKPQTEIIGPMLDPSTYGGMQFENAAQIADTLRAFRSVIRILASRRLRRKDPYACS